MATNIKNIEDLFAGVAKVHKGIAKTIPGAYKIPLEFRDMTSGANVQQMLEGYNKAQMFGKTAKGEPVRATIIPEPTLKSAQRMQAGRLPLAADVVLTPESASVHDVMPLSTFNIAMEDVVASPHHPLTAEYMRRSGYGSGIHGIEAMGAGYGYGSPQYQLMYDLINASGDVNRADTLTDVNAIARLHNVMSHGMGRGTYGGIVPVAETAAFQKRSSDPVSYSKQLFNRPVRYEGHEEEKRALSNLIPDIDLYTQSMSLSPSALARMTDDEITGLLATRSAQLASAYGPSTSTGSTLRRHELAPGDIEALRELARRHQYQIRAQDATSTRAEAAIGAQTMGRQITTEIAIQRLLAGEHPDDIIKDIISGTKDPEAAFKGRYAEGGLAHATR